MEKFLLQILGQAEFQLFDDYRHQQFYDSAKNLSLKTMVCCSSTIQLHIMRSYLQTHYWITAHDAGAQVLDPLEYGYQNTGQGLRPLMVQEPSKPPTLPEPCTCAKCARISCPCRKSKIKCIKYCGCCESKDCKNPYNNPDHSSDQ